MNRLSTAAFFQRSIDQMTSATQRLEKAQSQVATGKRLQTAADDPIGAPIAVALRQAMARRENFDANIESARRTLNATESSLNAIETAIMRSRDLALNAGDGTLSDTDRGAIAVELRLRIDEIMNQMNAQDASGDFLYSGFKTKTQPFVRQPDGTVQFAGDGGVREMQIGSNLSVNDRISGRNTFTRIPAPTAAAATLVGAGLSLQGPVISDASDFAAVGGDNLELTFSSATEFTVKLDGVAVEVLVDGSPVAAGSNASFSSGATISIQGASIELSGTPAAGNTVTVTTAASGQQDLASGIDALADRLEAGSTGFAGQFISSDIQATVSFLDSAMDKLNAMRSQVGVSLNVLDSAQQSNQLESIIDQEHLGKIENADLAQAISEMTLAQTTLQASQQTFARISSLSLFNYLN
ncbi:flagellar hook-associated protein 3 [Litorivicinus lipolyticus]|uniref:Flagellar hook-associated protein 3 n=1 Tax=Litorivicinus lipolyticus TaxID=418701 RepID=A0A5Q2Q751_9GAMM|nr:flagellar hook-associated protein FlgL [Litorivicinus lipolyticus]QGG80219.1 flagellar hook-associated protein 3 [Litorivicinus lipolyticus]